MFLSDRKRRKEESKGEPALDPHYLQEKTSQKEAEQRKQTEIEAKYYALQKKVRLQKEEERRQRAQKEAEKAEAEQRERKKQEEAYRLKEQQERMEQKQKAEALARQDLVFGDEPTNKNICLGMIKSEIVALRQLNVTKDDLLEYVNVQPEGRRNNNYSFTVASRTTPPVSLGWVPFSDTKVLGPLLDYRVIWWDTFIPRNKATQNRTPLYFILYCRPQTIHSIGNFLRDHRHFLAEPLYLNPDYRYFNPHLHLQGPGDQAHYMNSGYRNYSSGEDSLRQTQRDIEQLLESIPNDVPTKKKQKKKKRPIVIVESGEDEEESMKEVSAQSSGEEDAEEDEDLYIEGLTITLMPHQARGINWMTDREANAQSKGGILADMGLGKTIQTIGLMVSSMESGEKAKTLIITPLALIQQWADEIKSKTEQGLLKVLVHHGQNRTKNVSTFYKYDVVITTYQVVAGDMPSDLEKKKNQEAVVDERYGPLFQLKWHRVVLDEAQQIKNKSTRSSLSCSALLADKRWCLTGTPIQNNVDELFSLLRFLRIQPLNNYTMFRKTISVPILQGNPGLAMSRLKAVLMAIMLRRTKAILMKDKGANSFELPIRQKNDILLDFNDHERKIYDLLKSKTQDSVQQLIKQGQSAYLNMLCLLLRLRQACDHPKLIMKAIGEKDVVEILSDANATLNIDSDVALHTCGLCGSITETSTGTFCLKCQSSLENPILGSNHFKSSTKIQKMLELLVDTKEKHSGEKTIIFSQFTSMLDLLDLPLRKNGFKYCRYDGSMSAAERERSLLALRYDPSCTVMLISLKCGSLGLNLTAANRVILLDIWWNPALEEQAIDRVHRIGQKLPVYVTRLMINHSVEEKIIELQEKKAQLSKGALGDGSMVKNTKLSINEIRSLFEI
ncbi:SNF2 family N-terminal domain-containing protein [Sporodiniella umbellata]|nr:SNF2 family N-terminal domain-containing protein [Sporodiniella umbellata]